jgi:hypothetical protein
MENPRPRWRFRISALMLLVAIVGPATACVIESRNHDRELQRLKAELADSKWAATQYLRALGAPYQALARSEAVGRSPVAAGGSPDGTNAGAGR